jgi:thiol-disulfide isomerase/thioredoxin
MKKLVIGLILLLIGSAASSQVFRIKLTESSVIKDSAGNIIPYAVWKNLLALGTHGIKPVDPSDERTEFLLYAISKDTNRALLANLKPPDSKYFTTGKPISNFRTTDLSGKKINLKDLKGKIVVINFWYINCAPCRHEIPELNDIVRFYKDQNEIVFLGIALDKSDELQDFLIKTPFYYTIIDDGRWIANLYGIQSFPTHVILDKAGKVYFHSSGYSLITSKWIISSIEELLKQ